MSIPILVLACEGWRGSSDGLPEFAAVRLTRHLSKRAKQLMRICAKYGLNDVTTFEAGPAVHWEFAIGSPLRKFGEFSCSWTAVGSLHYFRLIGRDLSEVDSLTVEIANTALFDATEIQDIRRIGSTVEFRNVADDVPGFTQAQRDAAVLKLIQLGWLSAEDTS